jgi:hypothetical protein
MISFLFSLLLSVSALAEPGVLAGDPVVVNYNTNVQSDALTAPAGSGGMQKYRIVASTAVNYTIGANPAAYESTSTLLPALTVDYVWVASGDKIAVVKATGSSPGKFFISKVKE